MSTKNTNMAYESPVMETVELVHEGLICASGVTGSSGEEGEE